MIYYDITDYIKALDKFLNTPGKIVCGEGFNLVNGEWIPDEIYYQHNSRPTFQLVAKQNADGTHIPSETIRKKST